MGWWTGAADDLLKAAGAGTSAKQRKFVEDWHAHATSNCHNNPVDISHTARGSTNCKALTASRHAQNFTGQTLALGAFKAQIESGHFPHLLEAIRTTNPYKAKHNDLVVGELNAWGSPKFATFYADATTVPPPPPSPPPTGSHPKGHRGFHDMQKALARTLPTNLHKSKVIRGRVLRKLGAPRNLK